MMNLQRKKEENKNKNIFVYSRGLKLLKSFFFVEELCIVKLGL